MNNRRYIYVYCGENQDYKISLKGLEIGNARNPEIDIEEEYNVKDIIVNPPIDLSLFDIPWIRTQFGVSEYNSERPESEIRGPEQEIQENIE